MWLRQMEVATDTYSIRNYYNFEDNDSNMRVNNVDTEGHPFHLTLKSYEIDGLHKDTQ